MLIIIYRVQANHLAVINWLLHHFHLLAVNDWLFQFIAQWITGALNGICVNVFIVQFCQCTACLTLDVFTLSYFFFKKRLCHRLVIRYASVVNMATLSFTTGSYWRLETCTLVLSCSWIPLVLCLFSFIFNRSWKWKRPLELYWFFLLSVEWRYNPFRKFPLYTD